MSARICLRACSFVAAAVLGLLAVVRGQSGTVQFVFTSDAHYGLTRPSFRGQRNVDAHIVNQALGARINSLPAERFPKDGGLKGTLPIGGLDFVAEGGDIANRSEIVGGVPIQSAAASWRQFAADYIDGLSVTTSAGHRTPLYVVPGNHDASNAIGFHTPMTPPVDKTAMAAIFNLMMSPPQDRTATGPDHSIAIHTFRVDSPMKGALSAQDETKLSFQVATIDLASRTMTVRECLWNAAPAHPEATVAWGGSTTVALAPASAPIRQPRPLPIGRAAGAL